MRINSRYFVQLILLLLFFVPAKAQMTMDATGNMVDQSKIADSLGTSKEILTGMRVWKVDPRFGDTIRSVPDTLPYMFMNTVFTSGLRGEYNTLGNNGSPRIARIFIDRKETSQFSFLDPYDFFIKTPGEINFTNTYSPITNLSYFSCGNKTNGEDRFKALFAINAGKRLGIGLKFDYMYNRGYYSAQSTSHVNASLFTSYLGERYNMHFIFQTYNQKVMENGGITDDRYITHPETFSDSYATDEIPTSLYSNWNRNRHFSAFLTHRYNVGFYRKVKMTEEEIRAKKFALEAEKDKQKREDLNKKDKNQPDEDVSVSARPKDAEIRGDMPVKGKPEGQDERIKVENQQQRDSLAALEKSLENPDTSWYKKVYVPVTSFIHTAELLSAKRTYIGYDTLNSYYANTYYTNGVLQADSTYDEMKYLSLRNTFALAMLEGFNKWAKAGIKLFAAHELRRVSMPALDSLGAGTARTTWTEHDISIGGQLVKQQGKTLHYNAMVEAWLAGENAGQLKIDATGDLNFRLFGDSVSLALHGFFHRVNPTFLFRHFQSKHIWWDNEDLSKEIRTRVEGSLYYRKTDTRLRVAFDNMTNFTYLSNSYRIDTTTVSGVENYTRRNMSVKVNQASYVGLLTLQLMQNFKLGIIHWDNVVTFQKSTDQTALPVPDWNIYTNLYLRFKIAKVLDVDLGGDMRYFTKYYAPDYNASVGNYVTQDETNHVEIGDCPIINVYANFFLKHCRFFVMMSHVAGGKNYFYTPHYPLNDSTFRFGLSWNFNN